MTEPSPRHPVNHWGPFADDPWSDELDPVTGPEWEAAVESARQARLALTRNRAGETHPAGSPESESATQAVPQSFGERRAGTSI